MIKKSIEAKVRPLANPSLEKATLLGAARIYISKESLLSLTKGLDNGTLCYVERVDVADVPLPRREAALWLLPDKNVSPNVVLMSRAYQEATGLKIGDQVRITVADVPTPDAVEVVARDVDEQQQPIEDKHLCHWEYALALSMDRAEQVFPGMILEGVSITKLRRSFKVVAVNSETNNLANFKLPSTAVRITRPGENEHQPAPAEPQGELVVLGVPGLTAQIEALNRFLRPFGRPFWVKDERASCAFVIHGGRGTGKTMILRRLEETRWGKTFWIRSTDKLSTLRETFKQAHAQQPSIILIDGLEDFLAKDRSNREIVIETLGDELDGLSQEASSANRLPLVVVVVTCLDYMTDVPAKLQIRSRLLRNIALPIPRASERLEILTYLDPPMRPEEKQRCLTNIAHKTHAFNGNDLVNLVDRAKEILGDRLDRQHSTSAVDVACAETTPPTLNPTLNPDDLDLALSFTRPSAMHDINLKPPTIHWQDVGGQESLKKILARMIKIAKGGNRAFRRVLRHPPKGLLLYGPPGCSKTLSAQAMATESGFNFFAVKGAELLNMYVGESERAVRTLFERARAASPSIIFFDEIDSIGGQRGPGASASRGSGAVNMLTTLLTEMDGFETLTGVLVLAATNRPESIDPALLRPGRFDQVVYVGPPDHAAREAVFNVHLRGLTLSPDVDLPALATLAEGYSGAEIKAICNEAGLAVIDRHDDVDEDAGVAEEAEPPEAGIEITMADLVAAMERTPRNITQDMMDGYEAWRRQFRKIP
ncbi:hypothetical protein HIM_01368 [Hirsutella minnesotensis 3608]|nr:hypothetical protein HIM_01368 [Hirsutella minnesotensis 3608]